jgi:hypothetical protein
MAHGYLGSCPASDEVEGGNATGKKVTSSHKARNDRFKAEKTTLIYHNAKLS